MTAAAPTPITMIAPHLDRASLQEAIDILASGNPDEIGCEAMEVNLTLLNITLAIVRVRATGGLALLRASQTRGDAVLAQLLDAWAHENAAALIAERKAAIDDLHHD